VTGIPEPVVRVEMGRKFMVALGAKGDLYSWGRNRVGQLGLGDTTERRSPALIEALAGRRITGMSCGPQTVVAWADTSTIFSWGWERPGRHPDEPDVCPNPYPVVLPSGAVIRAACGATTIAVVDYSAPSSGAQHHRSQSDDAKPRTPFRLDSVEEREDSTDPLTVSLCDEHHNVRTFPVRSKRITAKEFLSSIAIKLKVEESTLELQEYSTSIDSIDHEVTRPVRLDELILELEETWKQCTDKSFGLLVRSKDLLHPVSFVEALRSTPYFAVRPSARGARDRRSRSINSMRIPKEPAPPAADMPTASLPTEKVPQLMRSAERRVQIKQEPKPQAVSSSYEDCATDGMLSAAVDDSVLQAGLLRKRSKGTPWKQRWVVLQETGISYYKSDSDPEPLRVISLSGNMTVEVQYGKKGHPRLVLNTRHGQYQFTFAKQKEFQCWYSSLKVALQKKNAQTQRSRRTTCEVRLSENLAVRSKVFARWLTFVLKGENMTVTDIGLDLRDGRVLQALTRVITEVMPKSRRIRSSLSEPRRLGRLQGEATAKLEAVVEALQWFKAYDVQFISTKMAPDIVDGKEEVLLDLLWQVLLQYLGSRSLLSDITACTEFEMKSALLKWCNGMLASSGVIVRDLHTSFANGMAFCKIVQECCPEDISTEVVTHATPAERHRLAFDVALSRLQVPPFLDCEDFAGSVDERSVMLYLLELSHAIHLVSISVTNPLESSAVNVSSPLAPRASAVAQRAISLPTDEKRSSKAMERFRLLNSSLSKLYEADVANQASFIFRVYLDGMLNYRSFVGDDDMDVADVAALVCNRVGWEPGTFRVFLCERGAERLLGMEESVTPSLLSKGRVLNVVRKENDSESDSDEGDAATAPEEVDVFAEFSEVIEPEDSPHPERVLASVEEPAGTEEPALPTPAPATPAPADASAAGLATLVLQPTAATVATDAPAADTSVEAAPALLAAPYAADDPPVASPAEGDGVPVAATEDPPSAPTVSENAEKDLPTTVEDASPAAMSAADKEANPASAIPPSARSSLFRAPNKRRQLTMSWMGSHR